MQGLTRSIQEFLRLEAAGGMMLIAAAVAAMACANSALAPIYAGFLDTPV